MRATRESWENSARLPQYALKKSAIRRSARSISRSTSIADKLLNVADCFDRSVSKRSRSASDSSRRLRSSSGEDLAEKLEPFHQLFREGSVATERVEDYDTHHRSADAQRDGQV